MNRRTLTPSQEADKLPPGTWKIVTVAAIGAFMAQLDATIVNVSLPDLVRTLHAPFSTIQWVVSGYLLSLALTLPLSGWLVSRIGGRGVYLWCFGAFTVTSGLCALAWSASSLIMFRLLQGMAGGLLAPMAQMTVARVAGRQMPRVASAMTAPVLLAPLLGPVVAGAVLSVSSWRWIFLLNVPVGLVALLLAALFLPDDRHHERPRLLDLAGLGLPKFVHSSQTGCFCLTPLKERAVKVSGKRMVRDTFRYSPMVERDCQIMRCATRPGASG